MDQKADRMWVMNDAMLAKKRSATDTQADERRASKTYMWGME